MNIKHFYKGRLDRVGFFTASIGLQVLAGFVLIGPAWLLITLGLDAGLTVVLIPLVALYLIIQASLVIERCHDFGVSTHNGVWVTLLTFSPIGIVVFLYLCFRSGDLSPNAYGAPDNSRTH